MPTNLMTAQPLHTMRNGTRGVIIEGAKNGCAARLAELGLTEGESVEMIRQGSPMLLQVGTSKLCLRHEDTSDISILGFE